MAGVPYTPETLSLQDRPQSTKEGHPSDPDFQDSQTLLRLYTDATLAYWGAFNNYQSATTSTTTPISKRATLDSTKKAVERCRKIAHQAGQALKAKLNEAQTSTWTFDNEGNPPSYTEAISFPNNEREDLLDMFQTVYKYEKYVSKTWAIVNRWEFRETATGFELEPLPIVKPISSRTRNILKAWSQHERNSQLSTKGIKFYAKHSFESEKEGDLSFVSGQKIMVTNAIDDNWFEGCYTDSAGKLRSGIFPVAYAEKCPPEIPARPKSL